MELMFNPSGEFWYSPEQIHSPHLNVGAPRNLFTSFKFCSDGKERVGCGKQQEATAPINP